MPLALPLTIPLTSASGRIFSDPGTPPTPTLRFFASSTSFVAASRVVGGSGELPRQEVNMEEEGRKWELDKILHES
jgi:hypothetical protein